MLGGNESYIYGISNFTIGSGAITYKVDKYTSATDNLTVKIGSTTIATRTNVTGDEVNTLTRTITFSSAELTKIYNAMPKVTKATFSFVLTSTIDGETIGTTTATATGTLPSTIVPKLTSISLTENISGISTKFGGFVKNKSKLNYSYSITNAQGSTISSYNLVIDGKTYTAKSGVTSTITTSGTLSYNAYVIDTRGRKSNVLTGTISVLDYENPKITTFQVIRCDAEGNENNEGEYAKYTINASISPVNNKNDKLIIIDYKKQTTDDWTTWKSYGGYSLNETSAVLKITIDDAYHFRVTLTDYFNVDNPATKIQPLSSAFTLMDILEDGTGLAFGKVATESNTLDIGFEKTNLSRTSYVGGQEDPNEKNMYFPNPDDSAYPHNSKVYGGSATSPVAIGMWDSIAGLPIFQYFDGDDYRLKFGEGITLRHGEYDVESVVQKVVSNASGRIHYKNGLLIQWGSVNITPSAANTPTSASLTFPIAYDYTPSIKVSSSTLVIGTSVLGVTHASDNASGTDLYVTRTNTTSTGVRWLAIGFKEVS